ncbi:MAG: hypothetical protein K6F01_00895 [Selenomonas sp.]|uniref:hypothetical protein n=1 Tax=Selenomonas sp. TaxID=2053611 RepID=UPI0025DE4AB2|nr:hypothetical protein [Selenomonas sp.]MCR5438004.1 hypothetical protein [Selenomonas sp.]
MNEIEKVSQDIYGEIRQSIIHVQYKVQQTVNTGMVQIYWEIGQQLDKAFQFELDTLLYADAGSGF